MGNDIALPIEARDAVGQMEGLVQFYESHEIANQDALDTAAGQLKGVSASEKLLKNIRMEMTRPLDESKKRIMDFFSRPEQVCARAKALISQKMAAYTQEQERIRLEAEAKARELARKEAEKLAKKAEKAEAKGNIEQAELLRQQSDTMTMIQPTVAPMVTKPSGVKSTTHWQFEILDAAQLPREYLMPNEKAIGEVVRSLKENTKIPGVRVFATTGFSTTGR